MLDNKLPEYLFEKAQSVLKHELGHHIVARELGFKVGGIQAKVFLGGGHDGEATIELPTPLRAKEDIVDYLQRRVQVLFAGVLAQQLQPNGVVEVASARDDEFVKNNGSQDFAKARELTHLLRDILYPDDQTESEIQGHLTEIWEDLITRAVRIVEECHEMIEGLGNRFDEMASVKTSDPRNREYAMTLPIQEINGLRNIIARYGAI